jgi:integrase
MASGTVYRRKTPSGTVSWVAHATWQEAGRRRQTKRAFRTKAEAKAALAKLLSAYQLGAFVAPNRITLAEFVEPWLDGLENQGVKATTLLGYRRTLQAYVLPSLGRTPLQALNAADLDSLYARLTRSGRRNGTGLALTTVHHVHAALHKLLHDAERKGLVLRNVVGLANAPSLTAARSKAPDMSVWTPAELRQFLESITGNRNEAMFRLIALTGMRRSEAIGLRWPDVDLGRRRLVVNHAATVVDGVETLATPKTRRSRRVLDLDPETAALLERHRMTQREGYLRFGVTARVSDRVFTNEIGDPLRPNSVGQAFRRLVADAGFG